MGTFGLEWLQDDYAYPYTPTNQGYATYGDPLSNPNATTVPPPVSYPEPSPAQQAGQTALNVAGADYLTGGRGSGFVSNLWGPGQPSAPNVVSASRGPASIAGAQGAGFGPGPGSGAGYGLQAQGAGLGGEVANAPAATGLEGLRQSFSEGLSNIFAGDPAAMTPENIGGYLGAGYNIYDTTRNGSYREPTNVGRTAGTVAGSVAGGLAGGGPGALAGSLAGRYLGKHAGTALDFDRRIDDKNRVLLASNLMTAPIVAVDILGRNLGLGSGKDKEQRARDQMRGQLQERGFIDKDFLFKFPDEQVFDFGAETIGDRGFGTKKDQKGYEVDFSNEIAGEVVSMVNPLSFLMTQGRGSFEQIQFAGMLTNAALMASGNDLSMAPGYVAELYRGFGLEPQDVKDGLQALYDEGKIDKDAYTVSMRQIQKVINWKRPDRSSYRSEGGRGPGTVVKPMGGRYAPQKSPEGWAK